MTDYERKSFYGNIYIFLERNSSNVDNTFYLFIIILFWGEFLYVNAIGNNSYVPFCAFLFNYSFY